MNFVNKQNLMQKLRFSPLYLGLLTLLLPDFAHSADAPLDQKQSSLKFTGHAFLHDFNGEAKEFTGSAQVDSSKPELVTGAKIEIQAAKMTTFESTRDQNMFQWLRVQATPEISFDLTRVISMDGKPAVATAIKNSPSKFLVSGNFTLNNVAKPLQAEALSWREGKYLVVTGTTSIDTTAHGLPIIKQFFMTVDKDVDVSFHLVFDLPSNSPAPVKP